MGVDLKQLCRQNLEEVFGKGNVDAYDAYCGPGYTIHDPASGGDLDLEGEKALAAMYKTAFPDLTPTVLRQWIDQDGDTVTTVWSMTGTHLGPLQGLEPTGRRCTATGCSISHFEAGRCVEEWVQWDALGLMRQLGVAPGAEEPASSRSTATGEAHAPH
jgi:predicted ester cyclase